MGLFSVKVEGDCFSSRGLPRFPRSNAQMASPFPGGRDPRRKDGSRRLWGLCQQPSWERGHLPCRGLWTRPQPIQTWLHPEASPEVALAQFLYLKNGPGGLRSPSGGPPVSGQQSCLPEARDSPPKWRFHLASQEGMGPPS